MLQSGDSVQEFELHILRQRRRESLEIHLLSLRAAWFNKYLMPLLFGEADYFILNARAIARADSVYLSGIERRAVEVRENNFLRLLPRVGHIAFARVLHFVPARERKRHYIFIAELRFELFGLNASAVDSRGRARLESAQRESEGFERLRQLSRREHSVRSALI